MGALSTLAATVQNGWSAYSGLASLFGLGGLALLALAVFGGAWLPGFVKTPLIVAGAVVLAFSGGLQSGQQRGAAQQLALDHARALSAEAARADQSEAVQRDMAAALTAEREAKLATDAELQRFIDDVSKATSSGELCGSVDDADRLRAFRKRARPG